MSQLAQRLFMASGGKKDPTYVDDVFSIDLYEGTSKRQAIANGIQLGNTNAGNSVHFNGIADNKINIAASADFAMGSGDFTWEAWVYHNTSSNIYRRIICTGTSWGDSSSCGLMWDHASHNNQYNFYSHNLDNSGPFLNSATHATFDGDGLWHHVAVTRSGNTFTIYVDGVSEGTATKSGSFEGVATPTGSIGACFDQTNVNECWAGNISNVRITKGQVLYTTNFTPSTQALTTTSQGATGSNVKLLCCNGTTALSATVTPNSLTLMMPEVKGQSFGPFTGTDGKGGLVWCKGRNVAYYNNLQDNVSGYTGVDKFLTSNETNAANWAANGENDPRYYVTGFNNSGFDIGIGGQVNFDNYNFVSWTFRRQKGFFDIVSWTGNNTQGRTIPHNLGCVPGTIIVKCTSAGPTNWPVYHKITGATKCTNLNQGGSTFTASNRFGDVTPTNSVFTVGSDADLNAVGETYVAYIFAGGASTAATARSVNFTGTGNSSGSQPNLSLASSSDFAYGTGDFTIEAWLKPDNSAADQVFFDHGVDNPMLGILNSKWLYYNSTVNFKYAGTPCRGAWTHYAVSRQSGTTRFFINGDEKISFSDTHNYGAQAASIGSYNTGTYGWNGGISNVRVVKGTAVYTSSFKPPTEPLTNITNTKLLCCNDSSPTGSTVTPGTITNNNSVTASIDTPFDDPGGYKFGEEGDQNLIKCGTFTTDTTNGSYLDLPWEPQWILYKHYSANVNWIILDCMRGWTADGTVEMLYPNLSNAGSAGGGYEELLRNTLKWQGYGNNYDFMYMAIRRPEPLVSKPVEVTTKAFHMLPSPPAPPSGYPWYRPVEFPVDMSISRSVISSHSWDTGARIIQGRRLQTDNYNAGTSGTYNYYDYQDGWNPYTGSIAGHVSWMWKRHAGFDVVPYIGNGQSGRQVKHSLGRVPEMMWVKSRDSSGNDADWQVYHKGLGQTDNDPEGWNLRLNTNQAENWNNFGRWNKTLPASTHFTVGNYQGVNKNNDNMIAMLFASVEGISKCGFYDGSNSEQTITTGFQPRFVIIKCSTATEGWLVLDTTRGWGAGDDKGIFLNTADAQGTDPYGAPTATGFTVVGNWNVINQSGKRYIYYAHA